MAKPKPPGSPIVEVTLEASGAMLLVHETEAFLEPYCSGETEACWNPIVEVKPKLSLELYCRREIR